MLCAIAGLLSGDFVFWIGRHSIKRQSIFNPAAQTAAFSAGGDLGHYQDLSKAKRFWAVAQGRGFP
ncbi:Unknown protein sequence [Pseudomonas syringae pv. cilantro]|uniref:Uncharacterized protein n=1 Tax=Pseudomonas syringae pv. cilantro TaxID=81035 RepID=A0A0N1JMQ0_PSESX|nr:Unknown protein sequence [Pseudomonas syringae pv. cilantro]